jgi:hypothetical protein
MIYLLNGINDSIATTTGMLEHPLRGLGYHPIHLYRETTRFWDSWSKSYLRKTAKRLILQMGEFTDEKRVLLAHSQGGLQGWFMMMEWAKVSKDPLFHRIVMVSPAMNRGGWAWEEIPFEAMLVIYNPDDLAVWAGGGLPGHLFGWAGTQGFRTKDPRITQQPDSTVSDGLLGHNHYFRKKLAEATATEIDKFLTTCIPQ